MQVVCCGSGYKTVSYTHLLEEVLTEKFSARVSIKSNKNKGKIEIEYTDGDDLNRILDILKIDD